MNGILWLASYPKSGNTWFRAFISNLLGDQDEDISINHMKTNGIFSSRVLLDTLTGIDSSTLTPDEIDALRPKAYNYLARISQKQLFIKVHDGYTRLPDGAPLLGTENVKAVYILRNPLDVSVSFANHASRSIDEMIDLMNTPDHAFCANPKTPYNQLRQQLLTWSRHVESWTTVQDFPVHIVRYEDMKLRPLETFTEAVRFIGLPHTQEQIQAAIALSSFDKLKAAEERSGFKEKPAKAASFFRSGKTGDWRNHLSDAQCDRIIADHAAVMRQFGYLDASGNPVY